VDSWSSAPRIREDVLIGIVAAPVSSADVKWQVIREKRLGHKLSFPFICARIGSGAFGRFWSHCFVTLAVPSSFHQKLIGRKILK
jgi:hypothetical protein